MVTDSCSNSEDKILFPAAVTVTKSNKRTEDSFESKSPPFCLIFFESAYSSGCAD